ncbi:hypothetical protein GCM10027168_07670 [Streptomyces capparidis]
MDDHEARRAAATPPERGALVLDTARGCVAEVMAVGHHGRLYLRPPRGGREWEAGPEGLRVLSGEEAARALAGERAGSGR